MVVYRFGPWPRTATCIAVAFVAIALCSRAAHVQAQDKNVIAAASAFQRAQQAELSGEHDRAAELFELADRISPTPEALRSATRARLAAGQLASAAGNAEELLRRYPSDAPSRELADQVLTRARPQLTRYALQCGEPCTVVVDGLASGIAALRAPVVYVTPGPHVLTVGFDDVTRALRVQGVAGETRSLRIAAPQPRAVAASPDLEQPDFVRSTPEPRREAPGQPPVAQPVPATSPTQEGPAKHARHGLSPLYFWMAAGATVATGAVALWSGLDLLKARDAYELNPRPTHDEFRDGERKDLRTTVLLGATGALAAATVGLAFITDFGFAKEHAALSIDRQSASLTLHGRF